MTEVITDLLERQSPFEQMSGASVPESVRAVVRQLDPQSVESPGNSLSQTSSIQRPERGTESQKHFPSSGNGANLTQVADDGISD